MLTIQVPEQEYFNESTNEFFTCGGFELKVEHSLNAISRWESKWKKPFLSEGQKTVEETRDYIRCMNLTPGIPEKEFKYLPNWVSDKIAEYITSPYTATTITNHGPQKKHLILTNDKVKNGRVTKVKVEISEIVEEDEETKSKED